MAASQTPEAEQVEAVHLVWDAPAEDVMNVGPVEARIWSAPEEVVRFLVCPRCGKLVPEPWPHRPDIDRVKRRLPVTLAAVSSSGAVSPGVG